MEKYIIVNNEKLYAVCKVEKYVRQYIERAFIKARYELETATDYNSTVKAERAYLRANKALTRLKNNVYDGFLYAPYLEHREIKQIINSEKIYGKW